MASIYKKADPGTKTMRWMAKVKVGGKWSGVSLYLLAPENVRLARQRANTLQCEIDAGQLSDETRAWMEDDGYHNLMAKIGRAESADREGNVGTWRAAAAAYLQETAARDEVQPVKDKVNGEAFSARNRRGAVLMLVTWIEGENFRFGKSCFTDILIDYIKHRLTRGIKPSSVWNSDYGYGVMFGEWMAGRKLCEKPNRAKIKSVIPDKPAPIIDLPHWSTDLAALRHFHAHRLDGWERPRSKAWKTRARHDGAWLAVLLVRGLGCRPSEARTLCWETIDLDANTVKFLNSKNSRHRKVPILYQWVKDGLVESRARLGGAARGAVVRTVTGVPYKRLGALCDNVKWVCRDADLAVYGLKKSQKLHIAQLIDDGFPPHVVAAWTDHSLSVQEKHYYEDKSYLPPDESRDYAEFGRLSTYGLKVRSHLGKFGREFGGNGTPNE